MFPVPSIFCRISVLALPVFLLATTAEAQTVAPASPSPVAPDPDTPPPGSWLPPASALPVIDPPPLPEPASARFGARGQLALGGSSSIGVSYTKYDASAASYLSATFAPTLDYFVLENFSVGLDLELSYADDQGYGADSSLVETKSTSIAIGPRFGWNIPLGDKLSWWLTGTLGFESNHATQSLPNGGTISTSSSSGATSTNQDGPYVSAYLPLLFHPAPHFFIGVGPSFFHEFAALQGGANVGDQRTTFGGGLIVGGYVGGDPPPPARAPGESEPSPTRTPSFGESGQLVLSSELGASLGASSYAGTASSSGSGQLTAGADYFVVSHFSVGGELYASYSNSSGVDANGNKVTNSSPRFGGALRLGVQIPIAGPVSLYPRFTIGLGGGSNDEKSAAGEDSYSISEQWVAASVPIVVQVAPHFIAGFGPTLSRDLGNTATFPEGQQVSNQGTTVGAGVLVGGWL